MLRGLPGRLAAVRFQLGCLLQDRALKFPQLPARLDAELAGQQVTGPAEGGQRLGLPSRAVQREH